MPQNSDKLFGEVQIFGAHVNCTVYVLIAVSFVLVPINSNTPTCALKDELQSFIE